MNEFFDLPWRERLAIEIRLACEVAGIGKNSLIGLLKSEEIKSVKIAGRRLVVVSSLKAYVEQAAQRSFEEGSVRRRRASKAARQAAESHIDLEVRGRVDAWEARKTKSQAKAASSFRFLTRLRASRPDCDDIGDSRGFVSTAARR